MNERFWIIVYFVVFMVAVGLSIKIDIGKEKLRDKSCEKQYIIECKFDIDDCVKSAKNLCRKK